MNGKKWTKFNSEKICCITYGQALPGSRKTDCCLRQSRALHKAPPPPPPAGMSAARGAAGGEAGEEAGGPAGFRVPQSAPIPITPPAAADPRAKVALRHTTSSVREADLQRARGVAPPGGASPPGAHTNTSGEKTKVGGLASSMSGGNLSANAPAAPPPDPAAAAVAAGPEPGSGAADGDGALKRSSSAPNNFRGDWEDESMKIKIGVCAMDKKARSKPMVEILERLLAYGDFNVEVFGDHTILNEAIEAWPVVDCLISFFSKGFPLAKAEKNVELRKPFLINDLKKQHDILDRRKVYKILQDHDIPAPRSHLVDRDDLADKGQDPDYFEETDEAIKIHGIELEKPFVEKPVDAEDHNINIYYPHSMGGGVKSLFRKIGDRSSEYFADHDGNVRRGGSFLYEKFLQTGGTDVKVYTVGPHYAHAEARKSPVLDGKVQRTPDGKEVRYPVLLSPAEKEIARMVCMAFGQNVCGFDLLRSQGRSYVCDVNGWSFVKNSKKFYDDVAGIFRSMILSALAPYRLTPPPLSQPLAAGLPDAELRGSPKSASRPATPGLREAYRDMASTEELRCILTVVRHGDRTPKQKVKLKVKHGAFISILLKYGGGIVKGIHKQAKLKSPQQLQDLLTAMRAVLAECEAERAAGEAPEGEAPANADDDFVAQLTVAKSILERGGAFHGINRKAQLKPIAVEEAEGGPRVTEILMIIKHGGILTHAGRKQAEDLGSDFRQVMYPQYGPLEDGLLRLHSTYRHDLKIYASDEGRVSMSAAAFAQGLLDLEGNSLVPILISLVKKDASMLEKIGKGASEGIARAKQRLYEEITGDTESALELLPSTGLASPVSKGGDRDRALSHARCDVSSDLSSDPGGTNPSSPSKAEGPTPAGPQLVIDESQATIANMPEAPRGILERVDALLKDLVAFLEVRAAEEALRATELQEAGTPPPTTSKVTASGHGGDDVPCSQESFLLLHDRWHALASSFYKKGKFNISKIPDIYDSVKYDSFHNGTLGMPGLAELYHLSKQLADIIIPNEYGISPAGKLQIGSKVCTALIGKILQDLQNTREESLEAEGGEAEEEEDYGDAEEEPEDEADLVLHRLYPEYAEMVNSPKRHVRTRIYFTSESHIHTLLNVIRHCDHAHDGGGIVSPEGKRILEDTKELDYLSQVVFRMFENLKEPIDSPGRFRIEVLFSPGAVANPLNVACTMDSKDFATKRSLITESPFGPFAKPLTLASVQKILKPFATYKKPAPKQKEWAPPLPSRQENGGAMRGSTAGTALTAAKAVADANREAR